jgi:pimeloyl-ACP methyl ester carboxylesterase
LRPPGRGFAVFLLGNARAKGARAVGLEIAQAEGVRRAPEHSRAEAGSASVFWKRLARALRPVPIFRSVLAGVNLFSHHACASCAEFAFRRPPRRRPSRPEQKWLDRGKLSWLCGRDGDLAIWVWGSGPRILLVHGWGGHAGRLTAFLPSLLEAGFGVATFDAPAHGISRGRLATLPDFAESLALVAGVLEPVGLVGHSMGAAACALAMRRGLAVRSAVLLAPPADPEAYTLRYARYLRLSSAAADSMKDRLQRRYGVRFVDLRLAGDAPAVPTLVIHDRRDKRVPLRDGIAITKTWPCAQLVVTQGLGHHRILRSPVVIRRAVVHLAAGTRDNCRIPSQLADAVVPGPWPVSSGTLLETGEVAQSRATVGRREL